MTIDKDDSESDKEAPSNPLDGDLRGLPAVLDDDEELIKDQVEGIVSQHFPNGRVTLEAKTALAAELTEMVTLTRSIHRGPLPAPQTLEHYERILPGAAHRVFTMAENEQAIRRQDNAKILHNDRIKIIGSIMVSVTMIVAGVYCGFIDQPALGIAIGTSGAVLGIFKSLNRNKDSKEEE